jgi:hypothetical protein
LFTTATNLTQPAYDVNTNGVLWVRAAAVYNCRTAVVVSKASQQLVPLSFPKFAINANGFTTSNNGNKVIIDTAGTYMLPSNLNPAIGSITVRCNGLAAGAVCTKYRLGSQLVPDTCVASKTAPYGCTLSPASASQTITDLSGLRNEAIAYGTYFSPSSSRGCPTTASQLAGVVTPGGVAPVFVDVGCPSMSFTGNTVINSSTQPGFLVLTNQTLSLGGTVYFYGLIYDANLCLVNGSYVPCTTASNVVTIQGTAVVQGGVNIDGAGMLVVGSSGNGSNGKANVIYDSRIFSRLQSFGGAAAVPNSFRTLPTNQ